MLIVHVMTVHVCANLKMLQEFSAGAGIFGENQSLPLLNRMALKVIIFRLPVV
jgi:hypothetical protein